jgi:RNA polymerase sigma factor (sigma-70 family)
VEPSDRQLVQQARQGDKQAFGELVKRHSGLAGRLAARLVGEEWARDMVQEGVLQAYLSLDRLRDENAFGSWLCGIVLTLCRSHCRAQRVEFLSWEELAGGVWWSGTELASPEPTPEEAAEVQELHGLVVRALEELSPKVRRAVRLFYFEQLSVREIAALLGCSTGAVKGRLYKGRGALRERLQSLWAELPEIEERKKSMVKVEIAEVIPFGSDFLPSFMVKLLDRQKQRYLPIVIGQFEGQTLEMRLRKINLARPLSHQFMASMLEVLGGELEEVHIEKLEDNVFYAVARIRRGDTVKELDCRPSDAMNLAVLTDSPIYVKEEVFEKGGKACTEEELEQLEKGSGQYAMRLREALWKIPRVIRACAEKPYGEVEPVRIELARGVVDRQALDGLKAGDLLSVGRESPILYIGEGPRFAGITAEIEGKWGLRLQVAIDRQEDKKEKGETVVELGQGWLTREQVEGLEAGVAVQMDKKLDEPLDVRVDGRPFARGEAMRIEGLIGVRIVERVM